MLSVPIRLPMLGREASDGCGGFPNAEERVWEPGKALVEKELDRCELLPGSNLRKLVAGAWLAGGLNEGRDGATVDDLPASKEGPEGRDGADRGWVNEGLGRLNDGLGAGLGRLKDGLG